MSIIFFFIIILAVQYGAYYLFSSLGFNPIVSDVLVDVVLAFVFALIYYRGNRKKAFKDPYFHRSVATYFLILFIISMIYYFLF